LPGNTGRNAIPWKETFMEAGGESYTMIPCLNVHPLWVQALAGWVKRWKAGEGMILKSE